MPELTRTDLFKMSLKRNVEQSTALRTKLAADVLKGDGEAMYAIRWLQEKPMALWIGQYSAAALEMLDEGKTMEEVKAWLELEKSHWYPEQSTSPFSNACNLEKFEALRRMTTWML